MKEPGWIWRFLKDSLERGKSQGKELKKKHKHKIKNKLEGRKDE